MKKFAQCTIAAAMLLGAIGAVQAKEHVRVASWDYRWIGPEFGRSAYREAGKVDRGTGWQKQFTGEISAVSPGVIQIRADGSGDRMHFFLYEGTTAYTPSWDGLRVGSKVKIYSDDRHRARQVIVIPFYKWLRAQAH
jgi:hypothetical protein